MTFVVAGTIARNRAWSLPQWYLALYDQQPFTPDAIRVLLNDCTDDSERLLRDMSFVSGDRWDEIKPQLIYDFVNTGTQGYERTGTPRYDVANLATLRNMWIGLCLERWPHLTHLWSVDSDVVPDADVLAKLLAVDEPIVGAVVRNSTAPCYNFFHGSDADGPRRAGTEQFIVDAFEQPIQVTMTGACVLLRRDVLDAGVRYGVHLRGEDVKFCIDAAEKGFKIWIEPTARCEHWMTKGEEPLRP